MSTQLESAKAGNLTDAMKSVARDEAQPLDSVRGEIASGRAVIPANVRHTGLKPVVVGRPFRTKINANIGRSSVRSSREEELEKLRAALEAGTDFVMDLSVGPGVEDLRIAMLDNCPVPLGTVPIYEAFGRAGGRIESLTEEMILEVIREHARQGVDFMTLHAGLLEKHVPRALKRVMGIVSRGGSIMAEWMNHHNAENPLYSSWGTVLEICRENDVTVSVGDGLRPGCLADASDESQFAELEVMGDLVRRCREGGVQVMVEGPGHIPFNEIQMNVEREREVCDGAPFYVLGPVVTDIAPGYDHITSSIGATAAAYYGASLLCYVTPSEHLGLPSREDVRDGIAAYRIAAHAADVARGLEGAREWDDAMARARVGFDWDEQFRLALNEKVARSKYDDSKSGQEGDDDFCSMCGRELCAVRATKRLKDGL
ncbi:MAG: phosphomethylpyrimidine synthase ThiC [Kiritimatiellia bacterium]